MKFLKELFKVHRIQSGWIYFLYLWRHSRVKQGREFLKNSLTSITFDSRWLFDLIFSEDAHSDCLDRCWERRGIIFSIFWVTDDKPQGALRDHPSGWRSGGAPVNHYRTRTCISSYLPTPFATRRCSALKLLRGMKVLEVSSWFSGCFAKDTAWTWMFQSIERSNPFRIKPAK